MNSGCGTGAPAWCSFQHCSASTRSAFFCASPTVRPDETQSGKSGNDTRKSVPDCLRMKAMNGRISPRASPGRRFAS